MRLTLGIDFDHGHWPGPLGERTAAAGEAWVGPAGLLSLLEAALGLGGPHESAALRAARLVPRVLAVEGFWSRSAAHNPLVTAQTLLRWRDRLWLQGWRGEALAPRLAQLAQVTAETAPGFADRLVAVSGIRTRAIESLELCEPRASWAPAWQALFTRLAAAGVLVSDRPPGEGTAHGDLALAQRVLNGVDNGDQQATAARDGSLQLLRPYGPVQAAAEVAAWLATLPELAGTVMLGGDPVLDRALRAQGLPTTGAGADPAPGALLQVLPLVLALGWDPADPQRALELLTLPVGPVPSSVRWRLQNALGQWPAVGSELWAAGLDEGLAEIEDEGRRRRHGERLAVLLAPAVVRGRPYPAPEVVRRTQLVQQWLAGRKAMDDEGRHPWDAALAQCRALLALVEASGLTELGAPQLDRFAGLAARAAGEPAPFAAEAGITCLTRPGSIVGPLARVVWWGFDLTSAMGTPGWFLSPAETATLAAAGIAVPDLGQEAMATAARWRRPLRYATETALLVCPQTGAAGGDLYPHPLWDEITGRLGEAVTAAMTVGRPLAAAEPPRARLPHLELPTPRRAWRAAPERVGPREKESLSGLSSFLGCSLNWALRYHAHLEPGRSNQVSSESALLGSLLHEIVERVLAEGPASPEAARGRAGELFDALGPRLAAPFYLPGADATRSDARRLAGAGAARLTEILAAGGRRLLATEAWHYREGLGAEIGGRLDLVVGDPPAVIDLKLGSGNFRRDELKAGTSGLAVYSYALQEAGAPFPPHGYFIFTEQTLLATDRDYFPQAEHVAGPGGEETWQAWQQAWGEQRGLVDEGILEAPGNPDAAGELYPTDNAVAEGRMVLAPPCRFCDFSVLCGRFFGEVAK